MIIKYQDFNEKASSERLEINKICKEYLKRNYSINEDLSINVTECFLKS